MPKVIVLYPTPKDVDAFERVYRDEHVPMVHANMQGLRKFVAARVTDSPAGPAPYGRVAELYFDSTHAMQRALGTPGAQATVAHAMQISTGGPITVLLAEDDA